ncbi:hypothetical protein [Ferrimonas senticii]|uniref:hypothetical protein n=1 Tax=Ferrimonas senticii TaxID=394566 RepID=UPI0012EC80BB|nr:hypothetical protein [Ferrimonas senticii]
MATVQPPPIKADKFLANQSVQQQAPAAFVLQPQAQAFVRSAGLVTQQQVYELVAAIKQDDLLTARIAQWSDLEQSQRVEVLGQLISLQSRLWHYPEPLLLPVVSSPQQLSGFIPRTPLNGRSEVYLNLLELEKQPPLVQLVLLLHESRHAYQLAQTEQAPHSDLAKGFAAGFAAEQNINPVSFGDIAALTHEYEAHQFANWVIGLLFDWQWYLPSLGSHLSQFNADGSLRADLLMWLDQPSATPLIDRFNQQLRKQRQQLGY